MKRLLSICLALVLVLPLLVACNGGGANDGANSSTEGYKIGIVTGTVSQGEEEFRAAENMIKEYGEDVIKHVTYPDKFAQETETTISQIASLASDPEIKAIIITQAVNGTVAAIDKVKESRDDILFILGAPHEDPDTVVKRADMILEMDQLARGGQIISEAVDMGATTFIHYSFPRHMAMELLAARRDEMIKKAEELNIEFIEVDAPDPTGDAGIPGSQQFIMEDVPREVEKYGTDTAFFSTNCSMMEPLIKQSLETGAIFPEQCCPSPYHAYPGALGIEIPEDKAGDVEFVSQQIRDKVAEKGGTGRFGTWLKPANPTIIEAGTAYAIEYAQGKVEKNNFDRLEEIFIEKVDGTEVTFGNLGDYDNFILFTIGSQRF